MSTTTLGSASNSGIIGGANFLQSNVLHHHGGPNNNNSRKGGVAPGAKVINPATLVQQQVLPESSSLDPGLKIIQHYPANPPQISSGHKGQCAILTTLKKLLLINKLVIS